MEKIFEESMKAMKDVQSFWENRTAQMFDELVKSQTFVSAMTKSLESSLDSRKVLQTNMSRWAEIFGVVTKKDIDIMNQQVYDQNIKLDKIVQILSEIKENTGPGKVVEPVRSEEKPARKNDAKKRS